jgi:quercetin dioxygenase-like cupin family protein
MNASMFSSSVRPFASNASSRPARRTPEGEWYDQDGDEWVLLVAGSARLRIDGEDADRELRAGDWILLPAHCRHRVT